MDVICGGLRFLSNFDSGNLAKVEKVISCNFDQKEHECNAVEPDAEFNLWTKPDCAGTEFENDNRTWFYFGVFGANPGALIKFNLINLNKQGKLYNQGMVPLTRSVPGKTGWERIKEKPTFIYNEGQFRLSFVHKFNEPQGTTYFAFCYPFTYAECQEMLEKLDKKFSYCRNMDKSSSVNRIYYYRELLCYSLCGQRVDLITISSCHGMSLEREPRLKKIFPDRISLRAHKFMAKRVFFLSSRVHPGETPSSFVFNGFLNFLLDENDLRAIALRRHFVFKLIPILNPDGVVAGHYRSDCRGVNLNRMYLDPIFEEAPSVYAAKCLILYHHFSSRIVKEAEEENITNLCAEQLKMLIDETEFNQTCLLSKSTDFTGNNQKSLDEKPLEFRNDFTEIRTLISDSEKNGCLRENAIFYNKSQNFAPKFGSEEDMFFEEKSIYNHIMNLNENEQKQISFEFINESNGIENTLEDIRWLFNLHYDQTRLLQSNNIRSLPVSTKLPHSFSFKIPPNESGIAFYVDLHGHASKRGCFMYGNYFEDEERQIQNMLLPKLISLNSPHFDFGACNFSEKNMYLKDRRDGLSKEGSGRVAIYKAIDIIHCYTLECNYNSGRLTNPIPPIYGETRIYSPLPHVVPPNYTPAIYEEVGKAMAIAALDMIDVNPMSRVRTSEYKNLNGLKDYLRTYLHMNIENKTFKKSNHKVNAKSNSNHLQSTINIISPKSFSGTNCNNVELNNSKPCRIVSQASGLSKHKLRTLPVIRKNSTSVSIL